MKWEMETPLVRVKPGLFHNYVPQRLSGESAVE